MMLYILPLKASPRLETLCIENFGVELLHTDTPTYNETVVRM